MNGKHKIFSYFYFSYMIFKGFFSASYHISDDQRYILEHLKNKFINVAAALSKPTSVCLHLVLFHLPYERLVSPNNTSKHMLHCYAPCTVLTMLHILAHLRTPLVKRLQLTLYGSSLFISFKKYVFRQSWLYPIGFQEIYIKKLKH